MNVSKFLEYGTVPAFLRVGKAKVDLTMRSLFISTTDIWQANITHEFYKAELRGGALKSTAFLRLAPPSSRREIFIGMEASGIYAHKVQAHIFISWLGEPYAKRGVYKVQKRRKT